MQATTTTLPLPVRPFLLLNPRLSELFFRGWIPTISYQHLSILLRDPCRYATPECGTRRASSTSFARTADRSHALLGHQSVYSAFQMQSPRTFDIMSTSTSISTPSPPLTAPAGTPGSRRPPRKSTLTQQQKNQKRQRATQDQLGTLEVEFNKNPTPTAAIRDRIAEDINMTERSVQIWFQNRYVS